MINCAHPTHFEAVLDGGRGRERIRGLRANASALLARGARRGDRARRGRSRPTSAPATRRCAAAEAERARRLLRHRPPPRGGDRGRPISPLTPWRRPRPASVTGPPGRRRPSRAPTRRRRRRSPTAAVMAGARRRPPRCRSRRRTPRGAARRAASPGSVAPAAPRPPGPGGPAAASAVRARPGAWARERPAGAPASAAGGVTGTAGAGGRRRGRRGNGRRRHRRRGRGTGCGCAGWGCGCGSAAAGAGSAAGGVVAAGGWGVAAGFGSSRAKSKFGNAHVPAGIGVARSRSSILGTGITRTGLVTRWPRAVTVTSTVPSASGQRKPRGSSMTCPEASRTTWGTPSVSLPSGGGPRRSGRSAGSTDVNVIVGRDHRRTRLQEEPALVDQRAGDGAGARRSERLVRSPATSESAAGWGRWP